MAEEAAWKSAIKAMINVHFAVYLLGVVVVGFGAGNVFAFLYWHLQAIFWMKEKATFKVKCFFKEYTFIIEKDNINWMYVFLNNI